MFWRLLSTGCLLGGLIGSLGSAACRNGTSPGSAAGGAPEAAPAADELPELRITDDTPHLLLTWVAADGDFHVEESIGQVPPDRRQQVRVVVTDQEAGSGASVYVADLTAKRADGSYAVKSMPRAEWEKLGAELRKLRMEALAPTPPGDRSSAEGNGPNGAPNPGASVPNGAITAIVYGADWCKPCHDAERYLKSLGVSVTKKNIEESRAAQAEMQQKLARVNRSGASIPVIDVMGRIFVGYSPLSLKQAVDAARQVAAQKHG